MAATMRAAVLAAPREVRLVDAPVPEPGPGQVRVRLEGCGLCGSDLPVWQGREWFDYPREAGSPGHEGWGVVDAVGPGVARFRPGERVAGLFLRAYAQLDVADEDQLIHLPEELAGKPFPGEPLACAFNAFDRCGVRGGDTVVVVGAGFLGAALAGLAAGAGARVIAVSRRGTSLEAASRMGAKERVELDDVAQAERDVLALTGGNLADVVIEATGKQAPLDLAAKLTRVRGRLVVAGYHQDGPRTVDMQLWNWRGLDVVNAHERDPAVYMAGMRRAADAIAEGRFDPTPLYTHGYPLARIDQAFRDLDERPDGFVKAMVMP